MTQPQQARPRRLIKRCNILTTMAVLFAVTVHIAHGYDFTNLGAAEFKRLRRANKTSTALNATLAPLPIEPQPQQPDDEADRHISGSQTPIHWFFDKLYGTHGANGTINGTASGNASFTISNQRSANSSSAHHANTTSAFLRIPPNVTNSGGVKATDAADWQPMPHERIEDEAVKYNVSFLGLKDPFARYATKLSYDYRIDVGEPSKNGRGSIVSLLNGTIYPLGSVGAMSAVGWSGGSNETRAHSATGNSTSSHANSTTTSNSTAVSALQPVSANHTSKAESSKNATSSPTGTSITPHSDGMTGIWLAFTSQHAVTGGYTLHSKHVSVTNNILFHNVTFRSNFTIDAHGRFSFVFTMGTVDEADQMSDDDGDGTFTKAEGGSKEGSPAGHKESNDSDTQAKANTTRTPPSSPIRLDGPHCTPMKGTQNTEAAFRMRCEGAKKDTTTTT